MPIWAGWANDHDVAYSQAKTIPMNLIWNESAWWFLSSGIHKVPRALITPMCTPMWPRWANDMWCTSTGQDGSNELDLKWICPVVAEFGHLQSSKSTCDACGHAHMAPMGKWPWHCKSTGPDSSNEHDLEWISPVVAELQCPQSLGPTNSRSLNGHPKSGPWSWMIACSMSFLRYSYFKIWAWKIQGQCHG